MKIYADAVIVTEQDSEVFFSILNPHRTVVEEIRDHLHGFSNHFVNISYFNQQEREIGYVGRLVSFQGRTGSMYSELYVLHLTRRK
jgi:hypothetical protein